MARLQKSRSGQPLFETVFNFNHFHVYQGVEGLPGVEVDEPNIFERTNFTFVANFQLDPTASQLEITFNYDANQLCEEQVTNIAGYYQRALEAMARTPDERYQLQSLLSSSEEACLLGAWNETGAEYSRELLVHQLVSEQAKENPQAPAVVTAGRSLSYGELEQRSNCLANYLKGRGVGPEVLVGVCLERSPEAIVALLGVLKAGGAYLPLDPDYPADRLAFMLDDSRAVLLLTSKRAADTLPESVPDVIRMDADWSLVEQESVFGPANESNAGSLAYVIYTSGSTGRPKGVAIEHGSLLNLVKWHQQEYAVTAADRATLVAAPGFDASVWEIWPYLTAGASIHVPSDEVRVSPHELTDWLCREGVTLSFLPTPLAESVLEEEWPPDSSLRALLTGGDRLRRGLSDPRPFRLVNHYGPTENTVVSTSGVVPVGRAGDGPPSIGRPIANTRAYILDRHLHPVPVGVAGELYVGGDGLARGYLHRPQLTSQHFIPDPFGREPGQRLYRTGDLCRWLPDGQIDFLGRIDHQVKVRGFRIELGEIESVLCEQAEVQQAVVVARADSAGHSRLVAYLVTEGAQEISMERLRTALARQLPGHMIPSAFVTLSDLPLTAHGKIDRQSLPDPDTSRSKSGQPYVAPQTETEKTLTAIWARLLEVERVGIRDNFFMQGGDSLSAVRLMAEIEQATGAKIPLRALFQYGTVQKLAELVDGQQERAVPLPLVLLREGGEARPLFFVHPAEGTVFGYLGIAQLLPEEHPFFGLQAPGLEGEAPPLRSVEAMATCYVEAIRKVQPNGPYLLAGWSFGGLVAFEMAQQLRAAGEETAWLGLFDSFVLSGEFSLPQAEERKMFAANAQDYLRQLGLEPPVSEEELLRHDPADQVELILQGLADAGVEVPDAVARQARHLWNMTKISAAAGSDYEPRPYPGQITLFRAADDEQATRGTGPDPATQWQAVSERPVMVHRVPGTHTSMMLQEENVTVLAQLVQESLAAASSRVSND
jgi:amino acid adenylation domain-containing protein